MTPEVEAVLSGRERWAVAEGDALELLRALPDGCIDAVVTDPPYGLRFMGKRWDHDVPSCALWEAVLRVAKPGAHLLAFAGTRTQHRMACAIEDAGFDVRDLIAWVYGSGFPKSLDVSKAMDKTSGAEREVVGMNPNHRPISGVEYKGVYAGGNTGAAHITAPATPEAARWQGWGTALKPALEPITVARRPLNGTVAQNVLAHGCGGLSIDRCRVPAADGNAAACRRETARRTGNCPAHPGEYGDGHAMVSRTTPERYMEQRPGERLGRWPANLIHDGSEDVSGLFHGEGDSSAARFFYAAKVSRSERDAGLGRGENTHPTVKPIALMRYLCRLVTPPVGVVLDPFGGSGSTGVAALREGFRVVLFERDPAYVEIARRRLAAEQPALPGVAA